MIKRIKVTEEHKDNAKLKSSATTQLVSQIVLSGGRTISYEYDEEERITKVIDSVDGVTEYTYDALGQLLTESVNGTVVNSMEYDNYGNIKSKNGIKYVYDSVWKDKLTAVGDSTITYDAQGNPLTYLGHTLTWEKGRQLKSFDNIAYTYNANGIRTSKTVDGIRHDYILDGAKIVRETWGNNTLVPLYDNEDSVCGIIYNEVPYYFLKNQQGDIIAITDNTGKDVARYSYDAWGICTVVQDSTECGIANINPFRYRGYYFDKEIGMYYLQSRYYDPTVGRFVNGDEAIFIITEFLPLNTNVFFYAGNNPIINSDDFGFWYYSLNDYNYKVFVKKRISKCSGHTALLYKAYCAQYQYNKNLLGKFYDYIYNQNNKKFANLKFSSARIKDVGCETIAIYNIMKRIGKFQYYPDVINECYINGLDWLSGSWGVNPKNIYKYFDAHYISYQKTTNFNTWISRVKNKKIGILSAWNTWHWFKGLHTVMITYKNKKYYIYNAYKNSKKEEEIKSTKELKEYMCGSFIIGYTF